MLGALIAIFKLLASRFRGGTQLLSGPAWALTSVLFFAYWLPELVSAFDAVDPARALVQSLKDLRYLPFLWLVAVGGGQPTRGDAPRSAGWRSSSACGRWMRCCRRVTGTSPLFFGIDSIKQAISGHGMCSAIETAAGRPPQRRARAVQPQAGRR